MLEIAVFNIESALLAASAGAGRLELCENPVEGGTTPSFGTLQTVREKIQIPVFPIIRPRGGDFLFSDAEFAVMKKDVQCCKQLQFEGVVIGLLHADGRIDAQRTEELVSLAYPMEVTFHRAFDRAADPLQAMEAIIRSGCQRILTSGQVPNAWDGRDLIKTLVTAAADRILIMPGSGVRSPVIKQLAAFTGAREFHASARKTLPSQMIHQNNSMQEIQENTCVDITEIQAMRDIVNTL